MMPKHQQKSVRRRLVWAVLQGWTLLGVWEGVDKVTGEWLPPDENDLFGIPPDAKQSSYGRVGRFVPSEKEIKKSKSLDVNKNPF